MKRGESKGNKKVLLFFAFWKEVYSTDHFEQKFTLQIVF